MSELGFQTSGRVKQRRARSCVAVLIAVVLLLGGAGIVVIKSKQWLETAFTTPDYSGTGTGEVVVRVAQQETATDIGLTLEEKGVVKSAEAFIKAAKRDPRSRTIQPGFYRLRSRMSGEAALAMLLNPESRLRDDVVITEGLRLTEAVHDLAEGTGIPAKEFEEILKNPETLELPTYAKGKPEGFLFPATYPVDPGTTAEGLLYDMVSRFRQEAERLRLEERARKVGMTPYEIVTVASIVEAEARRPRDFPKVARVIYNRLNADDKWLNKLQMDSTVHYAVNKSGRVSTTSEDRQNPSPYNTYVHPGLPPGPINSPGAAALEAALNPAEGDWLYFVAVNPDTGETRFASTWEEHQQNEKLFHQWCQKHGDRC